MNPLGECRETLLAEVSDSMPKQATKEDRRQALLKVARLRFGELLESLQAAWLQRAREVAWLDGFANSESVLDFGPGGGPGGYRNVATCGCESRLRGVRPARPAKLPI